MRQRCCWCATARAGPVRQLRERVGSLRGAARTGAIPAVVVHETGGPAPSLEGVGAVTFLLADPLRERYPPVSTRRRTSRPSAQSGPPARQRAGGAVQHDQDGAGSPVAGGGMPCAACAPYTNRTEFETAIARVPFPAIVRPDLLHAQQFTFRCATRPRRPRSPIAAAVPGPGIAVHRHPYWVGQRCARQRLGAVLPPVPGLCVRRSGVPAGHLLLGGSDRGL